MKKWSFLMLIILSLFVFSACGNKDIEPSKINEDTDKCDECNMAIGNNQFATQIISEDGKTYLFDDIGCMYKWIKENKKTKIAASFVRDYQTKEWIESEKATYVYDKTVKTPMAYNVISFTNKKDAEKYINEHQGKLLTYDKLQKHTWPVNEEMRKMNKMNHNHMGDTDTKGMESETHSED